MKTLGLAMLSLLLAGVLLQAEPPGASVRHERLNVLLIIADDLGRNLGCYGDALARTPNIDRLAARSVRFDNAYCQYPLCNPSRTSLLSGLRPAHTGIRDLTTPMRSVIGNRGLLPEIFLQHGYFTAGLGKIAHGIFGRQIAWSLPWQDPKGEPDGGPKAFNLPLDEWRSWFQIWGIGPNSSRDEEEPDGIIARQIAKLIEDNETAPFFLAAGFHRPHVPLRAPQKYFDLYPLDSIQIAGDREPSGHIRSIPPIALRNATYFPEIPPEHQREAIRGYYASVAFLDAQVGVLMETLDRLDLWSRTIVVLMSDHGWHLGEHGGLWQKKSLFSPSARVPLLIASPHVEPGVVTESVAEYIDLFPTLANLTGIPPPADLDGLSLVPVLRNPSAPGKKYAFCETLRPLGAGQALGRAVYTSRYAWTEWPDGSCELYDLLADPQQFRNLAADPAFHDLRTELRQALGTVAAFTP